MIPAVTSAVSSMAHSAYDAAGSVAAAAKGGMSREGSLPYVPARAARGARPLSSLTSQSAPLPYPP